MSRYVSWFSCGAASAVATKLALAKYENVVIAYCRVREEHPDNDRFLKDCEKWFGQEIIILEHEKYKGSIFNVFEKNYMRTPSGSPCTRALKKQVRTKFQKPDDAHIFGYTIEEEERANKFIDANNEIETVWPLIDSALTKGEVLAMIERAGIELPVMYKLGYEHNNCIGCVKGGMGYWNKIRKDFPEEFKRMADFEKEKGYTVLKEPDTSKPLYLHDLDPNRGSIQDEPQIQCGIFCEMAEREYQQIPVRAIA